MDPVVIVVVSALIQRRPRKRDNAGNIATFQYDFILQLSPWRSLTQLERVNPPRRELLEKVRKADEVSGSVNTVERGGLE
jgi:hypothetical protein